ncbi:hypothetical protein [Nocardioides zeae]
MAITRRTSFAALATTVTLVAAGCASNQDNTGSQAEAADAETSTITIAIDVPFHPIFDYLMATSAPDFEAMGYDVEFEVLDATTQVPSFGRGDVDVITTVPSFQPRIEEQYGIDTTYFFPMARWTPGPELLVAPDSSVDSIEDLAGKSVAIAPSAAASAPSRPRSPRPRATPSTRTSTSPRPTPPRRSSRSAASTPPSSRRRPRRPCSPRATVRSSACRRPSRRPSATRPS